jgi:hypothetical protein
MAPEKKREVLICRGRMSFRSLAPVPFRQGPPIPMIAACALAGTALAAVLIVSPSEMAKKPPPQAAYEIVVATRTMVSDNVNIPLPPAPPPPPKALMSENVTHPTQVVSAGGGSVRASFTVVNP